MGVHQLSSPDVTGGTTDFSGSPVFAHNFHQLLAVLRNICICLSQVLVTANKNANMFIKYQKNKGFLP